MIPVTHRIVLTHASAAEVAAVSATRMADTENGTMPNRPRVSV